MCNAFIRKPPKRRFLLPSVVGHLGVGLTARPANLWCQHCALNMADATPFTFPLRGIEHKWCNGLRPLDHKCQNRIFPLKQEWHKKRPLSYVMCAPGGKFYYLTGALRGKFYYLTRVPRGMFCYTICAPTLHLVPKRFGWGNHGNHSMQDGLTSFKGLTLTQRAIHLKLKKEFVSET